MKRQDIDIIKILSAFGIVWFHSEAPGRSIAYAGLVVFLVLSSYFATSTRKIKHPKERFRRYIIPYVIWCVPYGFINILKYSSFMPNDRGLIVSIFSGTSIHLWYLPYVFVSLLLIDQFKKRVSPLVMGNMFASLCIIDLATAYFWYPWAIQKGAPAAQYIHALYGICWGGFLGYNRHIGSGARTIYLVMNYVLLCVISLFNLSLAIPYSIGAIITSVIVLHPFPVLSAEWGNLISFTAECMLGVYLVHMFVLKAFGVVLPISWLNAVITFMLSLAFVAFTKKKLKKIAAYAL